MKRPAHSRNGPRYRARVRSLMIASVCLIAIIAFALAANTTSNHGQSTPGSQTSVTTQTLSSSTLRQDATRTEDPSSENPSASTSKQANHTAAATVQSQAYVSPIAIDNPSFPDTSTPATVEDEGLGPHQANTVLVHIPPGTSRDELQTMLAEANYVDTSRIGDEELRIGLVALSVAEGVSIVDAIDALEHIPGIDGAQPNFAYNIASVSKNGSASSASAESDAAQMAALEAAANTQQAEPLHPEGDPAEQSPSQGTSTLSTEGIYDTFPINDADAISFAEEPEYEWDAGFWQLRSVRAFGAWQLLGYDKTHARNPIGIAVIDTGANPNEVDLKDQIVAGYNSENAWLNDKNKTSENDTTAIDDISGHGSHVAGIAAATANNEMGIAGVSYNSNLVIIKAGDGSFYTQALVFGYTWLLSDDQGRTEAKNGTNITTHAEQYNVRVINMSLGGAADVETWEHDSGLFEKITEAKNSGILTVCAAGNSGYSGAYKHTPSDYVDALGVINLERSATLTPIAKYRNDAAGLFCVMRSVSSNYNEEGVSGDSQYSKDISAPGTDIWSTYKFDELYNEEYFNWGNDVTTDMSGTSMASPLVAGIAALIYAAGEQQGQSMSAQAVRSTLETTAKELALEGTTAMEQYCGTPGWDLYTGYGEVDAQKAVESALGAHIEGNNMAGVEHAERYTVVGTDAAVTWTSSDENVATINADGKLTPQNAGSTIISASYDASTTSMPITVIEPSIKTTTNSTDIDFVWSVDSATYAIDGANTQNLIWLWTVEASDIPGTVTIGELSGVLTVNAPSLEDEDKSITITATCASNTNIKVTKTIAVSPTTAISGPEQVYAGLGGTYSIKKTSADWAWSCSDAGVTVEDGITTCALKTTDQTPSTITLTAILGSETLTYEIEVARPEILGKSSIPVGASGQYVLNAELEGTTATWTATRAGAELEASIATFAPPTEGNAPTLQAVAQTGTTPITITASLTDGTNQIICSKDVTITSDDFSQLYDQGVLSISFKNYTPDDQGKYTAIFSNTQIRPTVVVKIGDTELVNGTDYVVSYGVNFNAGKGGGEVIITGPKSADLDGNGIADGVGTYSGSVTTTFNIEPRDIAEASGHVEGTFTYNGSQFKPKPSLSLISTLVEGTDYEIDGYGDNVNAGAGEVVVRGIGNFTGTASVLFIINRAPIPRPTANTGLVYTGNPLVGVANGTGYTVQDGSATNAGNYTALVNPDSNHQWATGDSVTSTMLIKYSIAKRPLSSATVTGSYTYTGRAITPSVSVAASGASASPTYSLKCSNNVNAGTANVTIVGTGNFSGEFTRSFTINRAAVVTPTARSGLVYNGSSQTGVYATSGCSVWNNTATNAGSYTAYAQPDKNHCWKAGGTGAIGIGFSIGKRNIAEASVSVNAQTYTGAALTPSPHVTWNWMKLSNGRDYTVGYSNNVNTGTGYVSVYGAGNYYGSKTQGFSINQQTTEMYRLYNPNSGEHFYTASVAERDMLAGIGWRYEGVGWHAPQSSSIPVYRLYNGNAGDHHYTMSDGERDMLTSVGWSYEGVGWYSDELQGVPLYRQYNPNAVAGSHNYTTSAGENDMLVSVGWHAEGIGWYGVG